LRTLAQVSGETLVPGCNTAHVPREPEYPFEPKSNNRLRAGQYWAIRLADGRFAAGRVMAVPAFGDKDTRSFVAGLMDWVGAVPPDAESIAGRPVVAQGKTLIEAITNTGGAILGHRPLELDGLVAIDPNDMSVGTVHAVWGWRTISNRAEALAAT
jgi:hypothetical protein